MFPNVQELGRGDLGQVQVRRLLCFVCHDALGGMMVLLLQVRRQEREKKNPRLTFLVSLVQTHLTHCRSCSAARRFLTPALEPQRQ